MDHAEIHRAGLSGDEMVVPGGDPLTIEQLRKMDGWPVWVTPAGFWALVIAKKGKRVKLICNDGEIVYADKEIELVGPVYAYPPANIPQWRELRKVLGKLEAEEAAANGESD